MSTLPPILCAWDGEVFRPLARFAKRCAERLHTDAIYPMLVHYERSTQSHRQYFAALTEIWNNLQDEEAIRFPTVEHLRKYALIHTGWSNIELIAISSRKDALAVSLALRRLDPYCVIAVVGKTIRVHTAKSQSYASMDKADFEASKSAVLDWASALIETPAEIITEEAKYTGR